MWCVCVREGGEEDEAGSLSVSVCRAGMWSSHSVLCQLATRELPSSAESSHAAKNVSTERYTNDCIG